MITATGPFVPGVGQSPCRIMLVGEAPGTDEGTYATPFVGASGQEQDRFLIRSGLHRSRIYLTNLIKCVIPGNTDPTPDDVTQFEGLLYDELLDIRPEFIITVGAFATRWFLGDDIDMETVYGLPQRSKRRGCEHACIIPTYHPAFGLYSPENKPIVYYGYQQAGKIIRGEVSREPVVDEFHNPVYKDWDGEDDIYADVLAVDTEGDLDDHSTWWGFSVSTRPGTGYVFRRSDPNFARKLERFASWVRLNDPTIIMHNALGIDIDTFRHIGIDFAYRRVYDTMIAAYMLRLEPQGLKPLAKRWCGMAMTTYQELIGDAAYQKQRAYLERVVEDCRHLKPEPRLEYANDGTARLYKPQSPSTRAAKILADYDGGEKEVELPKRWRAVDRIERRAVEAEIGRWPIATLDDIPLQRAISYSGRDPDATLRLFTRIREAINAGKLESRCDLDQQVLPVLEEMQHTGFMASRKYFEALSADMWERMNTLQSQISHRFNDDKPFNPMSQPQVADMLARLNIKGAKRTKTKKMSTSKKSLEHLRNDNEFVGLMFDWREHQKVKTSFSDDLIDRAEEAEVEDLFPVCCTIRSTRVESGRISAAEPNLTAMPVSTELGLRVRGGFMVEPPLKLFGADMSQIEMRVLADLSGDPVLCKLFRDGRDIHSETCIKIFGLAAGHRHEVTSEWLYPSVNKFIRNPTKRAGFGVITGISGLGLYDQIRMMKVDIPQFCTAMGESDPVDACNKLIKEWFKVYKGAERFLWKCREQAERDGYVRETGGLPKYLPGIWDMSRGGENPIRSAAQRESHSHIISGTAQTMLRRAMVWLKPQILALRAELGLPLSWTMQIHDEIIFTGHADYEDILRPLVLEALTAHAGYMRIPIEASWSSAQSWDKLK